MTTILIIISQEFLFYSDATGDQGKGHIFTHYENSVSVSYSIRKQWTSLLSSQQMLSFQCCCSAL